MTCKTLEQLVLNTQPTKEVVEELDVVTLQADWTKKDEEIGRVLDGLGGRQLPTVAIYSPADPENPIVFHGPMTRATLLASLKEAAAKGRNGQPSPGQEPVVEGERKDQSSLRAQGEQGEPAVTTAGS